MAAFTFLPIVEEERTKTPPLPVVCVSNVKVSGRGLPSLL